jgi:hypothetical protein
VRPKREGRCKGSRAMATDDEAGRTDHLRVSSLTFEYENGSRKQIAAHEPQACEATARQNQSVLPREGFRARHLYGGSQSPRDITVLLPMRGQGGEVLLPWRLPRQRAVGQAVQVPCVSLRGACRLQCERECASLVLSRVALAATQQAASQGCAAQCGGQSALSGYRSEGRSLWRDTELSQARPVCR